MCKKLKSEGCSLYTRVLSMISLMVSLSLRTKNLARIDVAVPTDHWLLSLFVRASESLGRLHNQLSHNIKTFWYVVKLLNIKSDLAVESCHTGDVPCFELLDKIQCWVEQNMG